MLDFLMKLIRYDVIIKCNKFLFIFHRELKNKISIMVTHWSFSQSSRCLLKIRFSDCSYFLMNDLAELELRRGEIQEEINGYRGTPGYNYDERLRLLLEIALLKRDMIDIQISLINTTNEEERRHKKQRIDTKVQLIDTKEQFLIRLLPPQPMRPGNWILFSLFRFRN